jgi:hypothetical protein
MSDYINSEMRLVVASRADYLCEYCLIHEEDSFLGFEVDHVISLKHSGPTQLDNLAYTCLYCNRFKGSDIGSILWRTRTFHRFFNPRIDAWNQHFRLNRVIIEPITETGEVTVNILKLNIEDRILERQILMEVDRYPTPAALLRIN